VPGATSNQIPGPTTAPINAAAAPLTAAATSGGGSARRESIVNYEVDKTIKVVRGGSGMVKRISAAVVVNHQQLTDAKGKTSSVPLTDQQIEKMTALVRETVGFNKERGDSVNLMNAPFAREKVVLPEVSWWKQGEMQDLLHSLAWPVGTFFFAALVLLGFIRPALKVLAQSQPLFSNAQRQLNAVEAEQLARPQLAAPHARTATGPTSGELALEDARILTRDNPAAVANIVKTWMNGEVPA